MYLKSCLVLAALCTISSSLPYNPLPGYHVKEFTSQRIVGGKPAPDGSVRYMVALIIGKTFPGLLCGGSIVSKNMVFTAAHCIEAALDWNWQLMRSLRGVAGSNKYTSTDIVIHFSSFENHPDYDPWHIKNDVGFLFPTEEIKLNHRVAIIPLSRDWIDGGERCFATGWGINEDYQIPEWLQLLHVVTMSPENCLYAMRRVEEEMGWVPPVDPAIEICTLHSVNHGMCNGDSGSPLVSEKTGHQVGVVSWGIPCGRGAPDVFVRVSGVWPFVEKVMGSPRVD